MLKQKANRDKRLRQINMIIERHNNKKSEFMRMRQKQKKVYRFASFWRKSFAL